MQFKQLVRDIELYIHIKGTENRHLIKEFVNNNPTVFTTDPDF